VGGPRDRSPARSAAGGAATRRATPAGSGGSTSLGNRAISRLVGTGGVALAAHPAISAAGNRAIQRLVDPVQRNPDEQQKQPQAPTNTATNTTTRANDQRGGPTAAEVLAATTTTATTPGQQQPGQEEDQQEGQQASALTGAQQQVLAVTTTPATSPDQRPTATGVPPPAHSVDVVTNDAFRKATTVTDGIGLANAGVSVANAGMATARLGGLSDLATIADRTADSGLGDLLPGVGLGLNVLGTFEGGYRADAAQSRAQALSAGASRLREERSGGGGTPAPRTRAEEIMARGAAEQRDEAERRTNSAILNGVQAATTAVGIGLGTTTAGASTLFSAGALGAMKGAYSGYHFLRRKATSGNAEAHAKQLLSAAHLGDPAALATLKRLNVPTDNLDDPDVWKAAVAGLAEAMPRDEPRYEDGGGVLPGGETAIGERPPATHQYESIEGDDPDDLLFDPLLTGPQIGRRERAAPRVQAEATLDEDPQDADGSFTVNPLAEDPRVAARRRASLDDDADDESQGGDPTEDEVAAGNQWAMSQQLPAHLVPNAEQDRSDDQAVDLPVVQRPRGRAAASMAAALSNVGGNQAVGQQPAVAHVPSPDRSPASEDPAMEEVTQENAPGHGTFTGNGFTGAGDRLP
jgi:hypothetical protein